MARRYYSSTAARTTLASGVDNSTTTFSVTAVSGWPSSFPYTLVIDQDTVNEEIVEVSARSGTTLTVTRGVDGTTAVAHSAGAAVQHGVSARDFDEPNAFINGTGTVTESLLATGSVTEAKLGTGAVTSAKILDGTIVNADINASAAIAQSKIANLTSDLASKANYPSGGTNGDLLTKSGTTTAWASPGGGLTLIIAETFTAISALDINNCFTSTYRNYRLVVEAISSTTNTYQLQFRASNVLVNGGYEFGARGRSSLGGDETANNASAAFILLGYGLNNTRSGISVDITNPQTTTDKAAFGTAVTGNAGATARTTWMIGGFRSDNTARDGLTLSVNTGTMTGTLRLYGYKNS